jgi:hypothetical protein
MRELLGRRMDRPRRRGVSNRRHRHLQSRQARRLGGVRSGAIADQQENIIQSRSDAHALGVANVRRIVLIRAYSAKIARRVVPGRCTEVRARHWLSQLRVAGDCLQG